MNGKLKAFSVALVVMVAGTLLYTPLTRAVQSGNGSVEAKRDGDFRGLKLIWWVLNNSGTVEIEGEAMTYHEDMLIVNTGEGHVRIALPEDWAVGTSVVTREMLFGCGYLRQGENVTVKALRANVIDKEGLSIYFAIGYEIVDDADVHAYAAMPLNIEA